MDITFEPLNETHLPLMLKWLETPHVKKWWDQDIVYTLDLVKEKFGGYTHQDAISTEISKKVYAYIVSLGNKKIGYIQAYNAKGYVNDTHLNLESFEEPICGIDLFIGEEAKLYSGLGAIIINAFINQLLSFHFTWCLIDPAHNNTIAIKAFEKAGFKPAEMLQTEKHHWMLKKIQGITMIITPELDISFVQNINTALGLECKRLSGVARNFESLNVYVKQCQDNQTVAAALNDIHGEILWLESIYVEKEWQNKGLGAQLITEVEKLAIDHHCTQIQLNTYFPRAMKFYLKHGFEVISSIPNWKFNLTCYLMRKILSPNFAKKIQAIPRHIQELELLLLSAEVRKSPEQLNKLLADSFYEIGASGTVYNKKDVITLLPAEPTTRFEVISKFTVSKLAEGLMLITYDLKEEGRLTKRTSIWRENNNQYQMIFHQGTLVQK